MTRSIVTLLCLLPLTALYAQFSPQSSVQFAARPQPAETLRITLDRAIVIPSTIVVREAGTHPLPFQVEPVTGTVLVLPSKDHSAPDTIIVTYQFIPLHRSVPYQLRALKEFHDSSGAGGRKRFTVESSATPMSDMFGPELSKSGSISRGFLVGSNRDLTVSSGFRLQMAGRLSDEIEILAALTDENTPLQPQGNTQTLQEIDNVFVEIKSPSYTATMGDFQYSASSGEFFRVNRKLQGARLRAEPPFGLQNSTAQVTGATSRGKFQSNQFNGLEGVQGPYRLTGKNNERAIIIIAGSEHVYIDGRELVRGDENDYTIEYGAAEVTFMARRLITAASRIVVDFEYADRQYTRNFSAVETQTSFGKRWTLSAAYVREGDDPDAPIDISLSDAEKQVLRNAGNTVPTVSGIVNVGVDSLGIGRGHYRSVDSTVNGTPLRFYRYEERTADALYNIAFTYTGAGTGDYRKEGIGRYVYIGTNAGSFQPVVLLPVPQLYQLYAFRSEAELVDGLHLTAEYAGSRSDKNRFSVIGDDAAAGAAYALGFSYHSVSRSLGTWDWSYTERFKQQRFAPLDRNDEVEFGRKWSTDSLSVTGAADERVRETRLTYIPVDSVRIAVGAGRLERTSDIITTRYDAAVSLQREDLAVIDYSIEQVAATRSSAAITSDWFRQKGTASRRFGPLRGGMRYEQEHRVVSVSGSDSVLNASDGFRAYAPRVTVEDLFGFDAASEWEWRNDDAVQNGSLIPQSRSITQQYEVTVREVNAFSASTVVALRDREFAKAFQSTEQRVKTSLVRVQSRYRPFSGAVDIDLLYDGAAQRTAKLERYFYKVRKGEGQYSWTDANGNGVADLNDEREFVPDRYDGEYVALTLNSENLVPVTTMKASSRLRLTPSRYLKRPELWSERVLSSLSSETFFRLEERSTEPDVGRIYRLDLSAFLRPRTTLQGYQFLQQDLFLFETDPELSFRFRFNQRHGLGQYSAGTERNYSRERSLRIRTQFAEDLSDQADLLMKDDNAVSSSVINRSRQITTIGIINDLSYRPERNIEIGFKFETSEATDIAGIPSVPASFNGQTVRVVYGLLGNGQIRTEFSREEVLVGTRPASYAVPYELTGGRDFGKNFLWSTTAEYRLAGNVQFSLFYSGRTTSRSMTVHNGRMEVRAYF